MAASKEVHWEKDPSKQIAWESLTSEAAWKAITEALEARDLADRPQGLDATMPVKSLEPTYDVARGLLKFLQTLQEQDEQEFAKLLRLLGPKGKAKSGAKISLADELKLTAEQPVSAADIALFGRMTTSEAFQDVEAACQVADGISTHPVDIETDYFTTVDDLDVGTGAAHVGEAKYSSAVFYHNLVVDFDELLRNLGAIIPDDRKDDAQFKALADEARQTACKAVEGLLRAIMHNVPSGKINSHAHNQHPSLILVEVKPQKVATNYLTAFHDPARAGQRPDGTTETILTDSVRKLLTFARYRDRKLKIEGTQRFLFLNDPDTEAAIQHLCATLADAGQNALTDETFFKNSTLKTCEDFESFVAAVNSAVSPSASTEAGGTK